MNKLTSFCVCIALLLFSMHSYSTEPTVEVIYSKSIKKRDSVNLPNTPQVIKTYTLGEEFTVHITKEKPFVRVMVKFTEKGKINKTYTLKTDVQKEYFVTHIASDDMKVPVYKSKSTAKFNGMFFKFTTTKLELLTKYSDRYFEIILNYTNYYFYGIGYDIDKDNELEIKMVLTN